MLLYYFGWLEIVWQIKT